MKNSDDILYYVNKPYPKIKVERENPKYGILLLQAYSGMVSEYTAISQYSYHKFKLMDDYPEVAKVIGSISIVEMHHLEILSQLIIKLGVDPRYWINKKGKNYYWDAKFVDYGKDIAEFLKYDIQAETTAIRDYKNIIKQVNDQNIIAIIKRIIEDEELHLKIFHSLVDMYVKK